MPPRARGRQPESTPRSSLEEEFFNRILPGLRTVPEAVTHDAELMMATRVIIGIVLSLLIIFLGSMGGCAVSNHYGNQLILQMAEKGYVLDNVNGKLLWVKKKEDSKSAEAPKPVEGAKK